MTLDDRLERWGGEQLLLRRDPCGATAIVAIHSTALGPARGGTRLRCYSSLDEAVDDALALAAAMTLKFAAVDFPSGGGKAVLAIPAGLGGEARRGLLLRYGGYLRQLEGIFGTGPDVGTTPADMDVIAEGGAPEVFCRTPAQGGAGDSGPFTALGVAAAAERVCLHLFGVASVRGRACSVQGLGGVGAPLVRALSERGALVLVADPNPAAVDELVTACPGVAVVDPRVLLEAPCDLLMPCALGGIITSDRIPRLRCRAIVGGANNPLADPEGGARALAARGILYAPDFIVNVGGALAATGIESLGWSKVQARMRLVEAVSHNLDLVFRRAEEQGSDPWTAARGLAEERLARARGAAAS
ncbi:MAG: Glu/Leu/Phe/Val dehydrogenase [Myxococcales bacterium]|nr:Glu/Leu/Phe/Val dehydrogenase [Myxococcales bacterium]